MPIRKNSAGKTRALPLDVLIFAIGLFLLALFLFRKCRYGLGNVDESFYLTVPYRLAKGDSLFAQEWHLSQMAGFLLYPFMKLFLALRSSTDGIILFFRYLCVTVQLGVSAALFGALRKYTKAGALLASLFFCIYTPFGIMALSYNSMGLLFLALGCVLIFSTEKHVLHGLGGVFFAASVLCCPYLAILYGLYVLLTVIGRLRRKPLLCESLSAPGTLLWTTYGIGFLAAVFLIFVFSRSSFSDFFHSLSPILNDPEHETLLLHKIKTYVTAILSSNPLFHALYLGHGILILLGGMDKDRKRKQLWFLGSVCLTGLHLLCIFRTSPYPNYFMFPLALTGLFCRVTFPSESARPIFQGLWIPGAIYTVCIHFSSNQNFYVISSAAAVCLSASVVMLCMTMEELYVKEPGALIRCVAAALCCLFLLQGTLELYYRWKQVFWEASIRTQTVQLTEGPDKGLIVSEKAADYYNGIREDLKNLDPRTGSVLFLCENTWLYLCGDWDMSCYSAWLSGVNSRTLHRLDEYYIINPHKLPDTIYVGSPYDEFPMVFIGGPNAVPKFDSYASFAEHFENTYGYRQICTTDRGAIILSRSR